MDFIKVLNSLVDFVMLKTKPQNLKQEIQNFILNFFDIFEDKSKFKENIIKCFKKIQVKS